jgi:hypothetical protein
LSRKFEAVDQLAVAFQRKKVIGLTLHASSDLSQMMTLALKDEVSPLYALISEWVCL